MLAHTKAFATYRTLSQAHLNFAVLVCHAVPALRADLALSAPTVSHLPDHFKAGRNPKAEVAGYVVGYQDELARSTLITVFSYFEAYISDALREIVDFHGGKKEFKSRSLKRATKFIAAAHPDVQNHKRKLQDNPTPTKLQKYQKHARILDGKGFRFPTDLLAHFGAAQLLPKLDAKRGMRAFEVPMMIEECLLFPIAEDDRQDFEAVRSLRNKIGHGRPPPISLKQSLHYASKLHTLAANVDRHIVEHFMVIQAV